MCTFALIYRTIKKNVKWGKFLDIVILTKKLI